MSAKGLQFGGGNAGRETDSAQITAGIHGSDTLDIIGMCTAAGDWSTRRITVHSQGGLVLNGPTTLNGTLNTDSSITCVSLTETSDRRLKDNIADLDLASCTDLVRKLRPRSYDLKRGGSAVGFVADEIERAAPLLRACLVATCRDTPPEGTESLGDVKSVSYTRLVTLLWGAVQQLQARVDALEA